MGSSDEGRQENSLRTVRYNSEVLYTNTGWSVHSPLGLALHERQVQSIHTVYGTREMSQLYVGVPMYAAHYCALSHPLFSQWH